MPPGGGPAGGAFATADREHCSRSRSRYAGPMLRAASGVSRNPDPAAAAREVAMQVGRALDGRRAAAVVFFATTSLGPGHGRFEMALRAATGAQAVVGCSTSGVVAGDGGGETGPGISAIALSGDLEARRFFLPSLRGRSEEIGREIGREARLVEREPRTILLLADTYNLAPDELLAGVAATAPNVPVIGAGAAEDGSTGETTVTGPGRSGSDAVAGIVLGGIGVRVAVSSSCSIHGHWHTITEASGNRILGLDGRPALAAVLASLPEGLAGDLELALRSTLAALAPRAGSDRGRDVEPWLARPFLGADPGTGALLVGDEVMAGMEFAVAFRDRETARRTLEESVSGMVGSGGLAGAIYLAGAERGRRLHGIPDLESAWLRRYLGDLPLAGAFCATGLAPVGGRNRFHQHAGIVVGFERA